MEFVEVDMPPEKQIEVVKFWDREYSIFTLSALVKMLEVMNCKDFGDNSFSSFVFFCHSGTSQHFRSLTESKIFETVVGEKFIADQLIGDEILQLHATNAEHLIGLFEQIEKGVPFDSDFIADFGLSFGVFAGANTCIQRSADYVAQHPQHGLLLNRLIKQRTKYEHVMSFYDSYLEKLCIKIAKKKGVGTPHLLKLLTLREFIDFMRTDKFPTRMEKREECCALFILPTPKLLVGEQARMLLKEMLLIEEKKNATLLNEEIKGMGIYPGKVRGVVQVITDVKDLMDFKEGNILVASTTLPQYNTTLTKAMGIITDEGGILTHGNAREKILQGNMGFKFF